jgi:hypothetical protein
LGELRDAAAVLTYAAAALHQISRRGLAQLAVARHYRGRPRAFPARFRALRQRPRLPSISYAIWKRRARNSPAGGDVGGFGEGVKRVRHPRPSHIEYEQAAFTAGGDSNLRMMMHTLVPPT